MFLLLPLILGKWKPKATVETSLHDQEKLNNNREVAENKICASTDVQNENSFLVATLSLQNHTTCKWKPTFDILNNNRTETNSSKVKSDSNLKIHNKSKSIQDLNKNPSENYTKGKWLPSTGSKQNALLRKSGGGAIQYWCSPCNRTLASKVVYERHLKSTLHFKRTLHDREFDDTEEINFLKSIRRPKPKPPESIFSNQDEINLIKRKRKKTFMKCEVCQSRVNKDLIGKHLISHYHCRKGDITSAAARKLVLENIHEIVLEHPFQCSICKFYCNTQEYFLRHWLSEDHVKRNSQVPGYFLCNLCKYQTKETQCMYEHLLSREHNEVVSVINRSVPIVIKKINPAQCSVCDKEFVFKIQLVKHCERLQHGEETVKQYKMRFVCDICHTPFLSNVALRRHSEKTHKRKYYICTPCNLVFKDIMEAKLHRRSQQHKYKSSSKSDNNANKKKCRYCGEYFNNFLLLKEHLSAKHPEQKIRLLP